jgi:hypothetical protein
MDQQHDDANCDHIRRQDQHDKCEATPWLLLNLQRRIGLWNDNFMDFGGWFAFCRRDRVLAFIACCRKVGKGLAEVGDFEVAELATLQDGVTPGGLGTAAANDSDGASGIVGKPLHLLADERGQFAGVGEEPVKFSSAYRTDCHLCLRAAARCELFRDLAAAM